MIDKKTFKKAIAVPLEAASFRKKGQSWYLDGQDAIVVLNLQKSDWADEYFINVGIWLKALGEISYRAENDFHFSHRLERLFPEKQDLIRNGTSLEQGNAESLEDLSRFIGSQVVPFLRACTEATHLKEYMASGRFRSGFVRKDAKRELGEDHEL